MTVFGDRGIDAAVALGVMMAVAEVVAVVAAVAGAEVVAVAVGALLSHTGRGGSVGSPQAGQVDRHTDVRGRMRPGLMRILSGLTTH